MTSSPPPHPPHPPQPPTPALEADRPPWPHAYALAAVFLLALVAYSTSFRNAFVFDDLQHVRDPPFRDLGALFTWEGYARVRTRWFGYVTFAVNRALGGVQVLDYHLVNFAIHLATSALVYALAILAFRTPRLRGSALAPSAQAIAFAAAVLFATHPVQTQAVAYVVQRFTSLTTLLYLLSVVLFLRWRLGRDAARPAPGRQALLYAGMIVAAVLGMKTKEIAFTAPFAVLLCELTFFDPLPWRRRLFLLPLAATLLVVPLAHLPAGGGGGAATVGPAALAEATRVQTGMSRLDYLLTESTVIVRYLRMLVWPAGQSVEHDVTIASSVLDPRVLPSVLLLATLAAAAAYLYRRTSRAEGSLDPAVRLVGFGIAWFFLALSVESSVIPIVDVMNEHRVYLPSAGLFVGLVAGVLLALRAVAPRRAALALTVAAASVATLLAAVSVQRNRVWASELSLWTDAAAKAPRSARAHMNLGGALCAIGKVEDGARELRRSIELDPGLAYSRAQFGAALLALGRAGEAERELREALRLAPGDPEATFNLAVVLATTGRREEATPLFRQFLEVAPERFARARKIAERAVAR